MVQQFTDVLAKPGFRRAAANLGWLITERAARFVLALLVGLLVARHLGPVRLGSLSYCMAFVALINFIPSLGLDAVLKRELLVAPEKTAELVASGLVLRLAAGAVAWLAILCAAGLSPVFHGEDRRLVVILGLLLFQPALFLPELWLQAHLRAKWTTAVQLGALAVASACRLGLIVTDGSLAAFAWVLVAEMALCAAGFFWGMRRGGVRISFTAAQRDTMRRLVAEAWPLMFATFAIVVYMKIDEVMLRHLAGPAAVGIYAAAVRFSEVWYFFPVALASSLLPALLRAREQGAPEYQARLQQYYDLSAGAAYVLCVPIALLAPWLVRIAYGAEFAEAGPILAVHIWSSIFVFLGVARGQWLVNEKLQRFYLAATCAGAVMNIALNFIWIPRWGGLGAAYATVVSYALAAWVSSYFHPALRAAAAMQTRALLLPFLGWRYLSR